MVFIGFFWVKKAIEWSKYNYDLILTVGFSFGENLTVGSSSSRLDQSSAVGSSLDLISGRWI